MASDRMLQINQLIKTHIGGYFIKELELPADIFITVSKVNTSRDLKHAKILINVIPDNKKGSALRIMKKNKQRIKKYIGQHIKIKFVPDLHFEIDGQEIFGNEVEQILDKIKKENEQSAQ